MRNVANSDGPTLIRDDPGHCTPSLTQINDHQDSAVSEVRYIGQMPSS